MLRVSFVARCALLLVLLILAAPAQAHDYWLEFEPLHPTPGAETALSLHVGEDFVAETERPMQRARTVALRDITAAGERDLLPAARDGSLPMLRLTLTEPGGHLLALERDAKNITLRALKFNRYLRHEGLRAALAERIRAGERLRRASERYSRYLKAFVQVGDAADGVSMKVVGHRIEIVPARDLATAAPGEPLAVRVLFEGKPLSGLQVEAFVRSRRGEKAQGQLGITDAAGRVTFTIDAPGAWIVRTVHMQRCAGCGEAQWESFWTSYSFAVPG